MFVVALYFFSSNFQWNLVCVGLDFVYCVALVLILVNRKEMIQINEWMNEWMTPKMSRTKWK